jgi:hypothetical protein
VTKRVQRLAGISVLVAWWAFIVVRMIADARRDHGPTGLPNDRPNWHNLPGDLSSYIELSAAELLVILLIVRPLSYDHSWRRALTAFALLTPWLLFWGLSWSTLVVSWFCTLAGWRPSGLDWPFWSVSPESARSWCAQPITARQPYNER